MFYTKFLRNDLPQKQGTIPEIDTFDSKHFGYFSDEEIDKLGPELRALLECTEEALLDARLNLEGMRATNTGVFVAGIYLLVFFISFRRIVFFKWIPVFSNIFDCIHCVPNTWKNVICQHKHKKDPCRRRKSFYKLLKEHCLVYLFVFLFLCYVCKLRKSTCA
jgi:hypothetical protein